MMQIIKESRIIHEIIGPGTGDILTFAYAICEAERLMFTENIPMDEIYVTKDIYPKIAKEMNKKDRAVARQIERMGNRCWGCMDEEQKKKYIGKELKDIRAPRDMIFYLAFYVHFDKSFYQVLEEHPTLLFNGKDG
ncbi:MAG: hypothetical protein HFH53_02025 [Hespellia sp.]|jgi:hypothetical protein|nr:hypothetical protein [Hespellia sp.]